MAPAGADVKFQISLSDMIYFTGNKTRALSYKERYLILFRENVSTYAGLLAKFPIPKSLGGIYTEIAKNL